MSRSDVIEMLAKRDPATPLAEGTRCESEQWITKGSPTPEMGRPRPRGDDGDSHEYADQRFAGNQSGGEQHAFAMDAIPGIVIGPAAAGTTPFPFAQTLNARRPRIP
jgi:hypothetical protein